MFCFIIEVEGCIELIKVLGNVKMKNCMIGVFCVLQLIIKLKDNDIIGSRVVYYKVGVEVFFGGN